MKDSVIPKIYRIFQLSPAKLDSECFHESEWTAMREPFLMTCWFDKLNLQKGNKDFWASTCNAAWLLYPFHQWWWSCDCGGPFWVNGSVSTPVMVLSLLNLLIEFSIARVLRDWERCWKTVQMNWIKEDENSSLMFSVVEEDLFVLVKWWVDGVATSCSFMARNNLNEEGRILNTLFNVVAVVLVPSSLP